ncbi:MAG: ABC-F family ATP-binding cassette domain-containing protein [Puniceicoccaceae bacterium]
MISLHAADVIEVHALSLRFGPQVIFDDITCNLSTRDRIGLAGRNGAGKTSFLKVLLGSMELDGGRVTIGKGISIGYLPQDGISGEGKLLIEEVEAAETSIQDLQRHLEQAYAEVAEMGSEAVSKAEDTESDVWEVIRRIEDELRLRESHKLRARAEKILFGLGFSHSDLSRSTSEFSGGWQMRIALAKLLLQHPDYLLLDEPTNHLDLPSQRWLENFLQSYGGGLVLISHDRAFLDLLTNRTYALSRGKLEVYAGNYSYYEQQRRIRREQLLAQKETQERQIESTERFINRFRAKASKASQVQSRIKQLEKIDRIEVEEDESSVFFRFPEPPRSNQVIVSVQQICKAYGPIRLFDGFDLKLERGQRLAVVGANGAGKSTLARMIAGQEAPDQGQIQLGEKTQLSYFAQHQTDQLDPEQSVLQSAMGSGCTREQSARDILGSFLFSGDAVFKKVAVLSGGEKNRLALARMLLKPANFLILDEPTNHLDIQSKAILQQALQCYEGAFFIISHDRDFLDPIVQQTLEINPRGHRMFWCNVSEYLEKVEEEARVPTAGRVSEAAGTNDASSSSNPKLIRKLRAERQARLRPLRAAVQQWEQRALELEQEVQNWEERMKDPSFFSNRPDQQRDLQAYDQAKRDLESAMEEWEQAQCELMEAEQSDPLPDA